ncbi:alpha-hydroxy-acid oxidizing enzyme [Longibacter salinarum]|uniref:Alpha-hydroxy-acid oxidizing enzyme n=1 Tax=Longibacter salinarum TaxID=1850348 RepID=A0A2A8CTQ0_9BACT|nr:alpha-hydroxy acid oxidase [Longibacter salinarum]PEN11066.1 alpha-hydroxy-acid oxidizing enzyme [Longibacter salinarum]
MSSIFSLEQYREKACKQLPKMVYDYYAGGASDEITLRNNDRAYDRLAIRYHVMQDVEDRSLSISIGGERIDCPILIAPTAFHRLASEQGELDTVRAAGNAGTVMILSTLATTAVEDVVAAASGPVWFQLYVYRDRQATRDLVRRAEAAGCSALVLTADAQVWSVRERDERNGFTLPEGISMQNLEASGKPTFPETEGSGLGAYVEQNFDRSLKWSDLDWLAGLTDLPVWIKGVVRGDDARRAAEHGADGVIVSNHGGRQLDTSPATITVLPEIVQALEGTGTEILMDGGIRRGTDVLKALALGADGVCIGRPILWGLAANGQAGVEDVLRILANELDVAMGLSGVTSVDDLTPDLIAPVAE